MSRLKVMHVIARMNVGGPAVEIAQLMNALADTAVEQSLVTGWCSDDEADYLDVHPVNGAVFRVPGLGRKVRPADDLLVLGRIRDLITQAQPDIVHTHTAKAGVLGRLAARSARRRPSIIHTHHGHLLHGYFSPAVTRAVVSAERQLARMTDLSITVGEHVRDDLLAARIGRPERYRVIRSGVSLRPLPSRLEARQALGLPEDARVVSMIGRLTQIKRPDRFADVARILAEEGTRTEFVVAGGGDQADLLAHRVARDGLPMHLLGWRDDIEVILAASDVLVLTSDNEGTPLSLIQAGLAGVPVVATDVGSVSEVVEHGRTGLLTPPESGAIAKEVAALLLDDKMRARLGAQARERMQREFSLDGFVDAHRDSYERLSSKPV